MKLTNVLDLQKNSLQNAVIHPVGADPGTPSDGQFWYRTDTDVVHVRANGTTETVAFLSDVVAGSIAGTLWNAQSVLVAVADDTPLPVTVTTNSFVGRGSGNVGVLTAAAARTVLGIEDGATADQTPAEILAALLTVDGPASALDADTLDGLQGSAYATVAAAVLEADYNANTILAATADNTPVALVVGPSTVVGRTAAGSIAALTATEQRAILGVEAGATADQSAAEILAALLTVDGPASALDADTLDGVQGSAYALVANTTADTDYAAQSVFAAVDADTPINITFTAGEIFGRGITGDLRALTAAEVRSVINVEPNATADQSAAEILALLLTVDGPGSGLDADSVDGIAGADIATETFVGTAISNLVASAPGTLDTLNELAAALGDDPNFATTVTNALALRTQKYTTTFGNGALTTFTITHSLNTLNFTISVRETVTGEGVIMDWKPSGVNAVELTTSVAPTAGFYTVTVIG